MTQTYVAGEIQGTFPEFVGISDDTMTSYWSMACTYISPEDGVILKGYALRLALILLTAHLAKAYTMIAAGQTSVVVQGATEGAVTVNLLAPPVKTAWQYWLSTTPYGTQLWAYLAQKGAGGLWVGGSLDRASYRQAGGVFL